MAAPFKKKNTIKQTSFSFNDESFSYRNQTFSYNEIFSIAYARTRLETKVVMVGSSYSYGIGLVITLTNGQEIKLTEQPSWTADEDLNRIQIIEDFLTLAQQKSWDNRLQKYLTQIKEKGYFQYGGWNFHVNENKFVLIESGKEFRRNEINIFKEFGLIWFKKKNMTWFEKVKQEFTGIKGVNTLTDTDVFFALLKHYFSISWNK